MYALHIHRASGEITARELIRTSAQKPFASQLVTERENFSSVNPEALHRY